MNSPLTLLLILGIIATIGAGRELSWPDAMLRLAVVLSILTIGFLILGPIIEAFFTGGR